MKITSDGTVFDDIYELTYELLNELELGTRQDGTVYDANTSNIIGFNGLIVKANINSDNIHYAGQGEVMLDILTNIKLVTVLFGHYLTKKQAEGMPFVSYFSEEKIDEIDETRYTALTIKYNNISSLTSHYYHNKCLKFIDLIFLMEDELVDLRNFDSLEDISE